MSYSQKSNKVRFFFGLFFFSVIIFLSQNAFSQSTISGFIYDKQRNPLLDMDIELLNDYYQTIQRTKSDSAGRYEFTGLADGRYSVRVYAFRYDLEDQTQQTEINTQNARGGFGSTFIALDFYMLPKKGGLAETELGVVFVQDVPAEAKKLYDQGIDDLAKKRTKEGITALNEAVKIFPNYFAALHRIGKELYTQQRYEESAHFMFKAVEVNPKSASAFYYLGASFFQMGKDYHKAALASFKKAQILAPSSMQILLALGRVERALGNFADAEKNLLQAKKISGGGVPEIHKELAELYGNDLKKYKEAADELELYLKASKMSDADVKKTKQIIANLREKAKAQASK
jgi:tetratricopeptide (TPR) repeat protein